MFLLLVLVIICLGLFHCLTHYSRQGRLLNKLPGPPAIPLLGSSPMFMVPPSKLKTISYEVYVPEVRTANIIFSKNKSCARWY